MQFAVVVLAVAFTVCWSLAAAQLQPEARKIADTGLGDVRVAFKMLQDCTKSQFGPCIKHKLLTALDRISEQPEMELFYGVRLVKDPVQEDARSARSSDPTALNSATAPEKESAASLDELVVNRIVDFFKSRSLQFKLLDNEPRLMTDGRKKGNKFNNSLLMYPFMMGGMAIPLAFGVLALLAGKALIIAKLALALSAIVGLKKLFSDGGSSHEYVSHGGGGGHYRRSLPGEPVAASNMAYSSYMPVYEEPIRSTTTEAIPL